jgi:Glycosyl hydrolase family 26
VKRGVVAAVIVVLSAAGSPGAAREAPATCGKVLPPSWGAYLGAFADFNAGEQASEDHVRAGRVQAFEQLAGRPLSWVNFSQNWFRGLGFPRERVETIWNEGAIPYIAFLPTSGDFYGSGPREKLPERRYTLQRIIDGVFDAQLRAWADGARRENVPILLSFGAEVNDPWGGWNGTWNGGGETTGYGDPNYPDGPERYRDAFRHIVQLFRAEGATNVSFVFHVDSVRPTDDWNDVRWYYPGDSYVDWIGISVYGSLYPNIGLSQFAPKLDFVYERLTALSRRPFAIAEMGTIEKGPGEKADWIRRAYAALRSGDYPRIRAATWWSMDTAGSDTRLDTSPGALAAFRAGVSGQFFSASLNIAGGLTSCRAARGRAAA